MKDLMNHEYVNELKHNQTPEELRFFRALQSVLSEHFPALKNSVHKQTPIHHDYGFYILDFYIGPIRLAFEIDGGYHWMSGQVDKDLERDSVLDKKCIKVIHIPNVDTINKSSRRKKLKLLISDCITQRLSDAELCKFKSEEDVSKKEFILNRKRQHLKEFGCDAARRLSVAGVGRPVA